MPNSAIFFCQVTAEGRAAMRNRESMMVTKGDRNGCH